METDTVKAAEMVIPEDGSVLTPRSWVVNTVMGGLCKDDTTGEENKVRDIGGMVTVEVMEIGDFSRRDGLRSLRSMSREQNVNRCGFLGTRFGSRFLAVARLVGMGRPPDG
jgi:hypothetical protein